MVKVCLQCRTPGSEKTPGEGNGNPLQCSCLGILMDGGAWWATVRGFGKSQTRLSDFTFNFCLCGQYSFEAISSVTDTQHPLRFSAVFPGSPFLDGSVSLLGRILFGGGGLFVLRFTLIASRFLSTWRPGILSWEFRRSGPGHKGGSPQAPEAG